MTRPDSDIGALDDIEQDLLMTSGAADVTRWGGKAVNLARLRQIGVRVPPWFALTSDQFDEVMQREGLFERIADELEEVGPEDDLAAVSEKIRGWIETIEFPNLLEERLRGAFDARLGPDAMAAVRSSARDEDDAEFSFAGLHESLLYVRRDGLADAVRRVWSSAYTERALDYRLRHDLDPVDVGIAVVIQEMIEPEVSGVVFTAEPATEDVETMVVNAVFGAGEGLVGKGFAADSFRIDKQSGDIERDIATKDRKMVFDADRTEGIVETGVDPDRRHTPTIEESRLREIGEVARRIEDHYRRPQDLEFCIGIDGRLYWLQTRPITTVDERGPAAGQRVVWDNSNIIESYSGVTTPMTFSFIEHVYTIVYRCFAEVMGVPDETVRKNMPVFENMLGLIRGEVYYNLLNWYRLIRLFPGFDLNKEFMESMMGVDESLDVQSERLETTFFQKAADAGSVAGLALRSLVNFGRIESLAEDFEQHFDEHFGQWERLDFESMRPDELMELYWEMEEKLLWNWRAPIINDFYVMIAYGLLENLCDRWCDNDDGTLQHDLVCGEGGIATKEASESLIRLTQKVRRAPEVREFFEETDPDAIGDKLAEIEGSGPVVEHLEEYLDRFGYRSMEELKLEEPTMRENPAFVFQMVRNYLEADESVLDLEARRERELEIRRRAEDRAYSALNPVRRLVFQKVLEAARRGIRNRENMRFKRTKIYGLVRELLLAVARDFAAEDLLEEPDDIFYLTIDEVWAFIKGTAVTTDLKGLVEVRRAEFEAYEESPDASPDDRFATYGPVYHGNDFEGRTGSGDAGGRGDLGGIGCCSGELQKEVKVIASPSDDMSLSGEILVAERTDPGWVPLYPSVSGVLIERGSVLSHSAIVAREMGLPTIIGIEGLTEAVETGDVVRMDGEAGTVEILD